MFIAVFALLYYARGGSLAPRSVAERPVWSIWLAYLATLAVTNLIVVSLGIESRNLFPFTSALSGFGFIAMSGHVWGGSGVFGLGFLIVALIMLYSPTIAPLLFGTMWLLSLYAIARHYR